MKVFIIYNPVSGIQKADKLQSILTSLVAKNIEYSIHITSLEEGPEEILKTIDNTYDALLISGGDGTFSETVQAMYDLNIDLPIQIVPNGTTNELASNYMDLSNIDTHIDNLFSGSIKELDIALNDENKTITYALSFGNFTDVTYRTPQKLKNQFGYKAYILFGFLTFRKIKSYKVDVKTQDIEFSDTFVFGVVSNTKTVGNIITFDDEIVELNDGLFEVLLIRKPRNLNELRIILRSIKKRDFSSNLFHFLTTDEITLHSKKSISWNHDGEYGGSSHQTSIKVLKKRIKVYT